jgi:hypothetical protein
MCTVLVLLRPDDPWPLLVGANRDERRDRPFDPPGRYWPQRPRIVAPRDRLAGGTWFGVNDDGVVATIVNGMDRLGPIPGKTSRGGLVLRALAERDAERGARAIADDDATRYRGFTALVADRRSAFVVANDERRFSLHALAPGHHMLTPDGLDVETSPRVHAHGDAFRAARPPDPARGDWDDWVALLRHADEDDPHRSMTVSLGPFGTVASTLVAIPATATPPRLWFAAGPPTTTPYEPLSAPWIPASRAEAG